MLERFRVKTGRKNHMHYCNFTACSLGSPYLVSDGVCSVECRIAEAEQLLCSRISSPVMFNWTLERDPVVIVSSSYKAAFVVEGWVCKAKK